MKEKKDQLVKALKDLLLGVIKHKRSTFLAVLIMFGMAQWYCNVITTSELVAYFGGIATVVSLFYRGSND